MYGFNNILTVNNDYFLKHLLVYVMEMLCVFCEMGTEYLYMIQMNVTLQRVNLC
jgi:hypothetical protein